MIQSDDEAGLDAILDALYSSYLAQLALAEAEADRIADGAPDLAGSPPGQ